MRRTPLRTRALGLALCALFSGCTVTAGSETRAFAEPAADRAADAEASSGLLSRESPRAALDGNYDDLVDRAKGDAPGARPAATADRLLIRTADLAVEVPRAEDAIATWTATLEEFGGYLSQRDGAHLVGRIPASQFEAAVARLRTMGRMLRESMQALDVTEQHRDLTIRLANARTARERLLALLERADKVEDLLKIENELRRLTDEIERMTAELENLDDRVAMSTITVEFVATTPDSRPTPRRRPSRFPWINTVGAEHVLRHF